MRLARLFMAGACLAVLGMQSGCGCPLVGCGTPMTFIVSSGVRTDFPIGDYRLQLSQGDYSTVIECRQDPSSSGICTQQNSAVASYTFNKSGLVFSIYGRPFRTDTRSLRAQQEVGIHGR